MKTFIRTVLVAVLAAASLQAAGNAGLISRKEVLAAIAVLEKDITSAEAAKAAEVVSQFGKESETVLLIIGPETLPWIQADAPEPEATVRAMLMAAYFAGDIKAQLNKREAKDDPYSGWLAAIKAYRQIRKKQSEVVIPEIEDLIKKEASGRLKTEAEELLRQQEDQDRHEEGRRPDNEV